MLTATATKRGTARASQIEYRIQSPDAPPGAVDGRVGEVDFDDANTFQASRCEASTGPRVDGYTAYVEIEIYPSGYACVALHFGDYHLDPEKRTHIELKANELGPLSVALSRAVENAKARGFLPATAEGAST